MMSDIDLDTKVRVVQIVEGTSVDGPGLRTSIYFAGCSHHCPECHNPHTWDINSGKEMSISEVVDVVIKNGFNVTFSGGDPLFQYKEIIYLAEIIKNLGFNIWCYTGYTFEYIIQTAEISPILKYIDVLVDGPFIKELRSTNLHFRGSSNQRIIDCKLSNQKKIVILQGI